MVDTLIVYVHGAFASQRSWYDIQWMVKSNARSSISNHFFEYDIQREDAFTISDDLVGSIEKAASKVNPSKIVLVGHSYGGVLCVAASHSMFDQIPTTLVTVSSPFEGTHFSTILAFFVPPLLRANIGYNSEFIKYVQQFPLSCKTHSFITTGGRVGWIVGPNDGIVCVASQTHFVNDNNCTHEFVDVNHFDILHSELVATKILDEAE